LLANKLVLVVLVLPVVFEDLVSHAAEEAIQP